jgi:hypothetical protein
MKTPEMKHYKSSEWHFELDIPKRWHAMPPVSANSPNEVIRFLSKENGSHILIVFREIHDPKQGLQEVSDAVQKILANHGFGNFSGGKTSIGSKEVLTLDFDRTKDGDTWSCRHYFVAGETLRYTLGFGTTKKAEMIELFDRVAKSFEFEED